MQWYSALSLGTRLALASAALSAILVAFLVSLATANSPRNALVDQGGTIIASQLAQSATEYMLENDSLALQALLSELTQSALISHASIADASHRILAESGSQQTNAGVSREFTSEISLHDSVVGHVTIHILGAASPAVSAVIVLLLAVLVFALVFTFVHIRLRVLDQALQNLGQHLDAALPDSEGPAAAKGLTDIDSYCRMLEQLLPATTEKTADKRAVLALRLPALGAEELTTEQLVQLVQTIEHAARNGDASIYQRSDGWLLMFTSGDNTALRTLDCARLLQTTLGGQFDFAMAMHMEAAPRVAQNTELDDFRWQRLCDSAYQMAQRENSLMLSRLALSDNGVHQRVTVEQDIAELYRVTGYCDGMTPVDFDPRAEPCAESAHEKALVTS